MLVAYKLETLVTKPSRQMVTSMKLSLRENLCRQASKFQVKTTCLNDCYAFIDSQCVGVRSYQQGEVSSKYLVYVLFILNIANQASLTCLANNDLTLQPTTRALRPTSQPRKSQQIAPSYLNPIICTGHSAVHCGKVGGIILVRGYHLITYSHLVAKTNLSAKAEGQLIMLWCSFSFPNKGQFTFI